MTKYCHAVCSKPFLFFPLHEPRNVYFSDAKSSESLMEGKTTRIGSDSMMKLNAKGEEGSHEFYNTEAAEEGEIGPGFTKWSTWPTTKPAADSYRIREISSRD